MMNQSWANEEPEEMKVKELIASQSGKNNFEIEKSAKVYQRQEQSFRPAV